MSSFFTLELDTTAPKIEVYAPSHTVSEITNEIVIVSNEPLAEYQDIYFVDSGGTRHDLTFLYTGNGLQGQVKFNAVPSGIGILYVRVMDSVHNKSDLISKPIHIMDAGQVHIEIGAKSAPILLSSDITQLDLASNINKIALFGGDDMDIKTDHSVQKVVLRGEEDAVDVNVESEVQFIKLTIEVVD